MAPVIADVIHMKMDLKNFKGNDNLLILDLHMSPNGFERIGDKLKGLDKKLPQIYIHVGDEGKLKNQVLRIGKAHEGVYTRWITSSNGHKNTFLWSIGELDKYRNHAEEYALYLLFFASLNELNTKLYVVTVSTKQETKRYEKELIEYFGPIWEQYKYIPRNNTNYPILTGKHKNKEIHASVTRLGGALKVITRQRNRINPYSHMIQDLINMDIRSQRILCSNNNNIPK